MPLERAWGCVIRGDEEEPKGGGAPLMDGLERPWREASMAELFCDSIFGCCRGGEPDRPFD